MGHGTKKSSDMAEYLRHIAAGPSVKSVGGRPSSSSRKRPPPLARPSRQGATDSVFTFSLIMPVVSDGVVALYA